MRDPARIPVMLVALGELWAKNPDWRLGQMLLNAANRPDISSLFNMEDDVLLRGVVALGERVTSPASGEQHYADEQHDEPDHEAGAGDGGEVDRHQDQDEAEHTE
jgi:hypothetical protein